MYTDDTSLLAQSDVAQNTVNRQLDRAEQVSSSQPEQALVAAQTALTLVQKNHLTLSEGKAYQRLARIYAERDDYVRVLDAARDGHGCNADRT